jgi:hypothetical protein
LLFQRSSAVRQPYQFQDLLPIFETGRIGKVFRRIFCLLSVAAVFWTGLAIAQEKDGFTADRHKKRNVKCEVCHGEATPKAPAASKACLTCHKSLEAVAKKTANYERNPHDNHLTQASELECTDCHHGHKEDTPLCYRCHEGMQFEKVEEEKKQ